MSNLFTKVDWVDKHPIEGFDIHKGYLSRRILRRAEQEPLTRDVFNHLAKQGDPADGVYKDETFRLAETVALNADVTPSKDKAMIFTGAHKSGAEALIIQYPNRFEATHTAPAGFLLEELNLFGLQNTDLDDIYHPWFELAKRYSLAASGHVHMVIDGECDALGADLTALEKILPPENTMRQIEIAFMLSNPKISSISGHDKWALEPLASNHFEQYSNPVSQGQKARRAKAKLAWYKKKQVWSHKAS